jgi:hypothetical protein
LGGFHKTFPTMMLITKILNLKKLLYLFCNLEEEDELNCNEEKDENEVNVIVLVYRLYPS